MLATSSFDTPAVALLLAGAAVGIVFAIVFALRFAASFPSLPAPGPETSDLGPEPPAVANLLVNRCHPTRAAAAATLIDLAARKHLELFEAGPDRFVVRLTTRAGGELTRYERQVLDLVKEKAVGGSAPLEAVQLDGGRADGWHERFARHVAEDAKARGLLRGRWGRNDWVAFGVLAGAALVLVAGGLFAARVENLRRGSSSHSFHRADWFLVALLAWAALLGGIRALRTVRYSTAGVAAAARWLGVKRFLRHDRSFADAPPAAVAVWDRILAYGTALGVARAAAAGVPIGAEDAHTAWSRQGGDWHQLHVEYPSHFGYGEPPRAVALKGLGRTVWWGALAFIVLPVVARVVWSIGSDATHDSHLTDSALLGLVAVFFVGSIAIGAYLLVRLADGVIRLWRGTADLRATTTVEGMVVKHRSANTGGWFAVDPGAVDHVKALHPPPGTALPQVGTTIRVTMTPHLHHVESVDPVDAPRGTTPAPR
jgi:hypothetical protein